MNRNRDRNIGREPQEIAPTQKSPLNIRKLLFFLVILFYLLHNDLWLWVDSRLMLGLPVGLTYHIAYAVLASGLMYLLVTFAWPLPPEEGAAPEGEDPQP